MLIGEFEHNIDPKGRIIIPSKFREDLGADFILTKGLDNCLFIYSKEEWSTLEKNIKALPMSKGRDLQRFFFSGACDVELDKQCRILIPSNLRIYARLDKEIIIVGASNRVEIWDKESWENQCGNLTSEVIAKAMDDMGF